MDSVAISPAAADSISVPIGIMDSVAIFLGAADSVAVSDRITTVSPVSDRVPPKEVPGKIAGGAARDGPQPPSPDSLPGVPGASGASGAAGTPGNGAIALRAGQDSAAAAVGGSPAAEPGEHPVGASPDTLDYGPALPPEVAETAPGDDRETPGSSAAEASASPLSLLMSAGDHDAFGLLAAWQASSADSAHVRSLRWWKGTAPSHDHLLYRLYQRARSRYRVREELGLGLEFFISSDSLAFDTDARSDSLVELGVAPGVFFWSTRSAGMRYLPPTYRSLTRTKLLTQQLNVDLDGRTVRRSRLQQGLEVTGGPRESYAGYLTRLTWTSARQVWKAEIKESLKAATVKGGRAGLVRLSLPFELPKAVRSIFGEGKPNLSVSGSERISFGGRSQWFPYRPTYEFQRKPSKFPQLEMKQDLTIRLKGSIGDKLDVDVDQSSQAQTSLANRIGIRYHGYDDEIIKKVDLGNTSLHLPGTEYVSYGGSHTGLFGISAEAQLGDLLFNVIISKEEGETGEKSSSTRSQQQSKIIEDYEYVKDRFFFLDDPMHDAYPGTGAPNDIIEVRQGTVILYLDDGDGDTQEDFATLPGYAALNLDSTLPAPSDTLAGVYYFQQLEYGSDYTVLIDDRNQTHPIIILNRYLDQNSTLAVTYYDEGRQSNIGSVSSDTLYVKMIRPRYDLVESNLSRGPWGATNRLMLRNVYPLHQSLENWTGAGLPENAILEDGFDLRIHYKGTVDGVEDPDEIQGVRLIRYLGLDYYEETNEGLKLGEDSNVDQVWVDFQNGYLFFPDLRPFAPGDSLGITDLRGRPGSPGDWDVLPEEHWNSGIYDRRSCARDRDLPGADTTWTSRYYLEVSYRTPVSELRIDAWDIIEGSEVVSVGTRRLTRDRDYRIDYQTGIIRLYDQASVGENDEINVTYKHAGGFGSVSKTLLGLAMSYRPEDSDFSFSTSWLYERRGSPDRRPRLGSEPTQIAVGEIAGRYARESMGLTRLIDCLPFLDARQPSRLSIEGGLGMSFPNPNTRNDLYIDDFEGAADDVYVRLNRLAWKPCSVPEEVAGFDEAERAARRGEIWWYSPYRSVQQGDLNPTLDYQEANDYRSVLEFQLWPYSGVLDSAGTETCPPEESWMGVIQGLASANMDLTRARFLDIWVNDFVAWEQFSQDTTLRAGTMMIEIGQMNEDALWVRRPVSCATGQIEGGPILPANRSLDTEDTNRDGQLDLGTEGDEDTGLDGLDGPDAVDGSHDDYSWSADPETEYQDYEELCEIYAHVNGTEANGRLDTEDLDGDNSLDQEDSYFRFRIDLADTTNFLETDVRRDYAGRETNWTLASNNGWRRFRIPLSDIYLDGRVGSPAWDEVKHVRIWFSGLGGWKRVQLGAVEIRANRWVSEAIRDTSGALVSEDEQVLHEEDFFPGVYNTKENADVYVPPFVPNRDENREQDNIREREQSLTLELRNFQPGHTGRVYMPYLRDQNYTGYEYFELWLNGTLPMGSEAEFFLRLCKDANADTTDFYEYRVPVPAITDPAHKTGSWLAIKIRLTDLSDLKEIASGDSADVVRELGGGASIRMKGHPYLTKIRRITLGVTHLGPDPIGNANVWVDELRLTEVYREVDYAMRMQVRTELSDFGHVDFSYRRVGADFTSIGGGGFSTRKEQASSYALSTSSLPVHRLLPRELGLRLPFSFQQNWSKRVPKYRTNDDLLVGDDPSDRDITESINRNYSLSISRDTKGSGLLRYTLDALSLSGSVRQAFNVSPYSQDSTTTRTFNASYSFPFGRWGEWNPYKNWKVRLLPTSLAISMSRSEKEQSRFRREHGDLSRSFVLEDQRRVRSGGLNFSTALKPISAVNYTFKQSRDLMLRQEASWLGGLNIGRETSRQEDLNANYRLRLVGEWFEPRLTWRGTFRGTFNRQGTTGAGGLERYSDLTNSQTRTVAFDVPLKKLFAALRDLAPRSEPGQEGEAPDEQESDGEVSGEADESPDGQGEPPGRRSPPTPRKPRASGGGSDPLASLIALGRTNASVSFNDRSTLNRVDGEPSLAYQLGFSSDAGVRRLDNWRQTEVTGREVKFDADFKVLKSIAVTARVSDSESESRSTGNLTGSTGRLLPEVSIRWGDLPKQFGLKGYFRSFKANTRYTRREKTASRSGELTREEIDAQWSPAFDLELGFKSGLTAALRVDLSSRHTEDLTALKRISDRNSMRLNLTAKKSLSITREITVPLKSTKQKVTTKLDLSLSFNFDRNRDVTSQAGYKPRVTSDTRKFEVALGGRYQFSRSVNGNLSINVGENADNKNRTRTTRFVGMSISAGFTF